MSRLTEPQQRVLSLICEMSRFAQPPSLVSAPLRRLLRRRLAVGRRLSSLMWLYSVTEAGRIAVAKYQESLTLDARRMDGDEPTGDVPLDLIYRDGAVQPLLVR